MVKLNMALKPERFSFGKYTGEKIEDIKASDPCYFLWAVQNMSFFGAYFTDEEISEAEELCSIERELELTSWEDMKELDSMMRPEWHND